MKLQQGGQLKRKVAIIWSSKFAYAIGLIVSDGNLSRDGRHIQFTSKDIELVEKFKLGLSISDRIAKTGRGGEKIKKYYIVRFSDKNFWQYLSAIGVTVAKSKTIQRVRVPSRYFADFLRGVFDGDGSFWTFRDTRWANSFGYKMTFASASKTFLYWLKKEAQERYQTKGFIRCGAGVYEIRYAKKDTQRLVKVLYAGTQPLFLKRKYHKIKAAFDYDQLIHPNRACIVLPE